MTCLKGQLLFSLKVNDQVFVTYWQLTLYAHITGTSSYLLSIY